jgi:heme A synthase
MQVAFGAAFRNDLVGLVPHVVGAIFVTMVLLVLASFVLTQFPKHSALKQAAWAVIAVVPVQIGLGILAYVGRVSQPEKASLSSAPSASMVAHVVVGAMTLAATVALALQVFYHVRPRAAFEPALSAER